jgi:hypothetical protein
MLFKDRTIHRPKISSPPNTVFVNRKTDHINHEKQATIK